MHTGSTLSAYFAGLAHLTRLAAVFFTCPLIAIFHGNSLTLSCVIRVQLLSKREHMEVAHTVMKQNDDQQPSVSEHVRDCMCLDKQISNPLFQSMQAIIDDLNC
eukprot:1156344-Pelagomonas_calceolata.AAC.1